MDAAPDRDHVEVARVASLPLSPHAVFLTCPLCDAEMRPEHAHYRCRSCGWRDSCCD